MTKASKAVLAVFLAAALAITSFVLVRSATDTPTNNSEQSSSGGSETKASASIVYTEDGFSPAEVVVSSGATINIKNDSSKTLSFRSDPHPFHTDNPELNVADLSSGESVDFTVSEKGSWGYHNHLNASKTGTIVVE